MIKSGYLENSIFMGRGGVPRDMTVLSQIVV
jgi:hypothetical protein